MGQLAGVTSSARSRSIFVEDVEGIATFAVELIDEGDDPDVAQAADLEQLAGLILDAARRVDHHHRRVHGRQRPVGCPR